jgi:hypothetical protein
MVRRSAAGIDIALKDEEGYHKLSTSPLTQIITLGYESLIRDEDKFITGPYDITISRASGSNGNTIASLSIPIAIGNIVLTKYDKSPDGSVAALDRVSLALEITSEDTDTV